MSDSMYRIKRIIADNEYFLLIYYILLFLTNYFFIWLLLIYLYLLRSAFFKSGDNLRFTLNISII